MYCKSCGKARTIMKNMGDGWYDWNPDMDEFLDRHNPHNKEDGISSNFFGFIEEIDEKVKKVGFRDENSDLDLGLLA